MITSIMRSTKNYRGTLLVLFVGSGITFKIMNAKHNKFSKLFLEKSLPNIFKII